MELQAMVLLGAYHGINPGMGWLFAVALGMQEGRRRAVWRSLLPLGLGHALAIAAALLVAAVAGLVVPLDVLRWTAAILLVGLGVSRLRRHRHPRAGGMRVTTAGLTVWSFIMATAHGAGLMVLPFVLAGETMPAHAAHASHAGHVMSAANPMMAAATNGVAAGVLATAVHGLGYLLITALVAAVVYEKVGVGIVRRAWINLDLLWAGALMVTGALILAP